MKIAILGTRGIPNNYGGFEEFAEKVSNYWVCSGHEVLVFCESNCVRSSDTLPNGVDRVFVKTYPLLLRGFYLFLYDYQCTKLALKESCDIIYHSGYQSSAPGNFFLRRRLKSHLVYNMDGLEWKRSKWSKLVQLATLFFEKLAAKSGAVLIADNIGIQNYLMGRYGVTSEFVGYGADEVNNVNLKMLGNFDLSIGSYNILVARFEPENNLEAIIRAHISHGMNLVIVSNDTTQHYRDLVPLITSSEFIRFLGPLYNKEILNALRCGAQFYFHGHSVGGTNPSLLEAMACKCRILAHKNPFNLDVLRGHGYFWEDSDEIITLMERKEQLIFDSEEQLRYLRLNYQWKKVADQHLLIFESLINK